MRHLAGLSLLLSTVVAVPVLPVQALQPLASGSGGGSDTLVARKGGGGGGGGSRRISGGGGGRRPSGGGGSSRSRTGFSGASGSLNAAPPGPVAAGATGQLPPGHPDPEPTERQRQPHPEPGRKPDHQPGRQPQSGSQRQPHHRPKRQPGRQPQCSAGWELEPAGEHQQCQHQRRLGPPRLGLRPSLEHRLVPRLEFPVLGLVGCQRGRVGHHGPGHAAVINSAVNSAVDSNTTYIVVPNTSYELLYGSIQPSGSTGVSFAVTADGATYQLTADCNRGTLDGSPPQQRGGGRTAQRRLPGGLRRGLGEVQGRRGLPLPRGALGFRNLPAPCPMASLAPNRRGPIDRPRRRWV